MTPTRDPAPGLADAVARLAATPRLLVALDFDGTLTHLIDDPRASRMIPEARAAVDGLEALDDTWVGFVSGRSLASLVEVTEAGSGALLIASHGAEARLTGSAEAGPTGEERERLDRLDASLRAIAETAPGSTVEHKPLGIALHTRRAAEEDAVRANERAHAAGLETGGVVERLGKDVIEFSVREETKGDGIGRLRAHVAATAVLFAGDDVTDEDAFAVLGAGDVGIKVGQGKTAAPFRVSDPESLAAVLHALARERAGRGSGH